MKVYHYEKKGGRGGKSLSHADWRGGGGVAEQVLGGVFRRNVEVLAI